MLTELCFIGIAGVFAPHTLHVHGANGTVISEDRVDLNEVSVYQTSVSNSYPSYQESQPSHRYSREVDQGLSAGSSS